MPSPQRRCVAAYWASGMVSIMRQGRSGALRPIVHRIEPVDMNRPLKVSLWEKTGLAVKILLAIGAAFEGLGRFIEAIAPLIH